MPERAFHSDCQAEMPASESTKPLVLKGVKQQRTCDSANALLLHTLEELIVEAGYIFLIF